MARPSLIKFSRSTDLPSTWTTSNSIMIIDIKPAKSPLNRLRFEEDIGQIILTCIVPVFHSDDANVWWCACELGQPFIPLNGWTNGIDLGYRCCDPDVNYDSYLDICEWQWERERETNFGKCYKLWRLVLAICITSSWIFFNLLTILFVFVFLKFSSMLQKKIIWNIFLQDEWINKIIEKHISNRKIKIKKA